MKRVYLTYAKRTPIGRIGGSLKDVRVDDLLAGLFTDFKNSQSFSMEEIDDVLAGCTNQAGEDNRNVARMSLLLAGFPYSVPGATINRLCASSLDAIIDAMGRINLGLCDAVLVGGTESMTRSPFVMSKASSPYGRDSQMFDSTFGWRFVNPKMKKLFPQWSMGETAEELAKIHNITRDAQDEFALNSHMKAIKSSFINEIVPVVHTHKKGETIISEDECPRPDTTIEKLGKLAAVFRENGTVTAGNASPMNDGASCVFLASEEFLKKHNLEPILEITGVGVAGVHPNTMGIGPVESTKVLMKRFNKKISDFDVFELNEAFAAQVLSCTKELDIDLNKVNLKGGAIALGHPLGASGARIVTTLTHIMKENPNLKKGLASMCVGVGQGVSVSFERC
ncbi:3-oxoadipyl-CoA thiolase [Bacteriovorax sp. BSW11_IV]|uniref:thiolase family protein n=1 Tax=Bacteriovorax sp. BSW11_IV TaxID=1353529 RepID=UPI00038A067A|nr:acetyl-CoA C-acyltransferase [Bacteriovorax sp. BSW11_IV]EQC50287.1 3-oxoadipyl-CoA thiolase [Bacteriovorax sp. BSW11_IV]